MISLIFPFFFLAFEVNRIKNGRIVVVYLAQKVITNILSTTQNKAEKSEQPRAIGITIQKLSEREETC